MRQQELKINIVKRVALRGAVAFTLAGGFFGFGGLEAAADPCLPCSTYLPLIQPLTLGEQVAAAGIASLRIGQGGAFAASPGELIQAQKLKLSLDTLIPEHCKPKAPKRIVSEGSLVIRHSAGLRAAPFTPSGDSAWRILGAYNSVALASTEKGCDRASADYASCMNASASREYGAFSRSFSPSKVPGLTKSESQVLSVYHGMLNARNSKAANAFLRASNLSEDQVAELAKVWGARMRCDYNRGRNNEGWSAEGVVSMDSIMSAARHNTAVGYCGAIEGQDLTEAEFGGICRDIASGQGMILEASGRFKDVIVFSHAKSKGSYHVVSLARSADPKTPNKVYQFNYGDSRFPAAGDARVFSRGRDDIAINYRGFKPGGRMIVNIQSELGKYLTEAASFDIRDVDALARADSTLTGASFRLKSGTGFHGTVGQDTQGSVYKTVGVSQTWNQGGNWPGKAGLVVGNVSKAGDLGGSDSAPIDLDIAYLQLEQGFRSNQIKITPNLQARIEAAATAYFMGAWAHDSSEGSDVDGKKSGQTDMRVSATARVDQTAWKNRFLATYKIGAQVSPGIRDVRDNRGLQIPIPVLNHLLFSAEGRLRLSRTKEGSAYLVAAATVLRSELGYRGRGEVGIIGSKAGVMMTAEGRLGDSAPYEDGSLRRLGLTGFFRPTKLLQLDASGYVPVEKDLPSKPGAMGTLTVRW